MWPLFLVAAFVGTSLGISSDISAPAVVDGAYIVQLKTSSSLSERSKHDVTAHNSFRKRALDLDINYDVRREFTNTNLFYGMSINLPGNDTLEAVQARLNAIEGVEAVFPVEEYSRISLRKRAKKSVSSEIPSPVTTGTPVLEPRAGCSSNNCLREVRRFSVSVEPFCHTYTMSINPDPSAIPSYLENCDGSPSKVSSACSCLVTTTTSASGASTTLSATSTSKSTSSVPTSSISSISPYFKFG
jgi:hypothetical protein